MTSAMLLMLGGCLMMLEPLLRGPVSTTTRYVGNALREAFPPPPPHPPRSLERLLEQIP